MKLPDQYEWLTREPGPKMILEGLKIFGTTEGPGSADNPLILQWGTELGIDWYSHDSIPWCGLAMGIVAFRAGHQFDKMQLLSALAWTRWGIAVDTPELGDVLIFKRTGGGHVTLYVGEDQEAYHCMGGNQGDMYDIERIDKTRLYAIRRPKYITMPSNVRRVMLSATGVLSTNEA